MERKYDCYRSNQNKYSDIDIHIILDKSVDWRERGNRIVDGFVIEYFANPVWRIPKYMENDYNLGSRTEANMFYNGRILFDKCGDIAELKHIAQKEMLKEFNPLGQTEIQQIKYSIWDEYENLMHLNDIDSFDFDYLYFNFLDMIITRYSRFLCTDLPSKAKIGIFLSDKEFAPKYNIRSLPDENFSRSFIDALKSDNNKSKIQFAFTLKEYVLDKMGGFDIGSYTLRTPAK